MAEGIKIADQLTPGGPSIITRILNVIPETGESREGDVKDNKVM